MVSVTISHVIGTVALIGLFITASMSYSIYFSEVQEQANIAQLRGIADHVSNTLLDIYSIGLSSEAEQLLVKSLDIPSQVSQSSYNLSLVRAYSSSGEVIFVVLVKLTWKPSVYAESQLAWKGPEERTSLSNGTLPQGFNDSSFLPKVFVLSGVSKPAVWCIKSGTNVTLGLGVMV